MKLPALLEAVATLVAIRERGLDHVDPAAAHRDGITAVLEAAVAHHTDVEERMAAIEENGMPVEAAERLAAAESKVASLTGAVEHLESELRALQALVNQTPAEAPPPAGAAKATDGGQAGSPG